MGRPAVCLLLFAFQLGWTWQTKPTYKVAVVEYYPIQNDTLTPEERTNGNVAMYIELLDTVKNLNLDLIVYPESTITTGNTYFTREGHLRLSTVVPDPADDDSPCATDIEGVADYLKALSCAADLANVYLLANVMEKAVCEEGACADDLWNMYNTNVVFDRDGKIIARYRKFNLFGEYPMNVTPEADVTTFTTDFDVTFGTFTCFDLLFEKPALQLVRQGVRHIVFPTMWFSELPFLSALQAQAMFAVEHDVAFMAAGANDPVVGSGGSGFYIGKQGPGEVDIIGAGGTRVYVTNMPKTLEGDAVRRMGGGGGGGSNAATDAIAATMDSFYFKLDDLAPYASEPLNLSQANTAITVCHEEFCCDFNVTLMSPAALEEDLTYYQYRMVAFSGVKSFSVMFGGVDVCGLVFCVNSTLESCGVRFPTYNDVLWPVKFLEISIAADFLDANSTSQFPNTLLSSIRPLANDAYEWSGRPSEGDGGTVRRTIKLLKPQCRLMTFGIYGRDVSRDAPFSEVDDDGGASFKASALFLFVLSAVVRWLSLY